MNTNIRFAKEEDYNQIENIMRQVHVLHTGWRPDIYRDVDIVLPKETFLEHVEKKEVIVATNKNHQVVGVIIFVTRNISGGPLVTRKVLFIDSMAVDEGYRGKGIGHSLFDYIKEFCKEQKFDGLELQVNAKNIAAREMYKKYGFTEKSINMEFLVQSEK